MDLATQEFLEIKDIREGVLMLKNNDLRGILMISSMNFALKSDEEQSAIIYAFQSFLNSLDFPCQIVVQSRSLNITPYIDGIKALRERQTNELLKAQISSYADFIKEMVQGDNVMTKNFYVVVPYAITAALGAGAIFKQSNLTAKSADPRQQALKEEEFEKCKNQLWQRMEFVAMGLKRCGLEVIPLTTLEIIELFWAIHHPAQAEIGYYPEITPELLK